MDVTTEQTVHGLTVDAFVDHIRVGDRLALSRAITLVESTREDHQAFALRLVHRCLPFTGQGLRIGITGPPGAGKSTLVDALGAMLSEQGKRVAVLAIDPSSKKTGGSILADKTRMTRLAAYPDAFIRPSPNAGNTGGLAARTREALILCEAAGYDVLFVETVGVGQAEFDVYDLVDMLLLVVITGAGDEVQGIKRGIMEMADLILVNKADGDNERAAALMATSLERILHLIPPTRPGWNTAVQSVSAIESINLGAAWAFVERFALAMRKEGLIDSTRHQQAVSWMRRHVETQLIERFWRTPSVKDALGTREAAVARGQEHALAAAEALLNTFYQAVTEQATSS